MEEILARTTDPKMRDQMEKVAQLHGYLSTGAFAGIQMFNIAERILGTGDGDRLFVTCETYHCLPDSFQALGSCTIGNKGLRILDYGKMAATITRRAPAGSRVKAVRVILDPAKTVRYPRLHSWYMKTEKVPHPEAISLLIQAGEGVYSWRIIEHVVPEKPQKVIVLCEKCQESFIRRKDEALCPNCLDGERAGGI
ncbi:MAG: FmdE, Molybdenum formylmethanofuran dehydrogenase operon [Methanosaeta sp. PtaB.Bin039]|nr:MAG: FmdE, Molybdenum formylmethanofuran dehydrogenase operon [Methanosaeta sp. PtaB.Bin039]OPY44359.1 MAG: FmdE, Molybdenum formylmethanofuran dehydrogenase operon [Methanosaeta sp. PtaU1.Bin028]HOT06223.1 FmdE family protein [Methanotrichaceae archaeon]HQF15467.1 FmdE family protein [Methanotrichaceae archaeon]HQI90202.1 FmdE family protein [Methanotrichaceae archaeon]